MYLKTLTIKGFKSFAQPTTFEFEQGVTAVVGPNGSGKSNVVDALAWVMGEQGAKTLRGGKMEDVIFAGTATRSPLGRAEVVLTIDNSDGALPIEYSEVALSRTLFRNGTSEYAINGETCRLLDVQELLSDSGLGREMHVIVGQGQLDAVLRATPEDRRGFIEEAAGILKHRRRKERTQRKLEAMQANFTRLNDLAGELRRQLKPLGAQAEIAREAQGIQATVREAKGRILADDVVRLTAELEKLGTDERASRDDRSLVLQQVSELQLRQQALEAQTPSDELDAARRVTFDLLRVEERFRSLYNLATQRIALLSAAAPAPEVDPQATLARARFAAENAESLAQAVDEKSVVFDEASSAREHAQADVDALDRYIAEQNAFITRHDLRRAELAKAVEVASGRLDALEAQSERHRTAVEEAEARVARAADELVAAEAGLIDDVEESTDAAEAALADATAARDAARERRSDALRAVDAWSARFSALSTALSVTDSLVDVSDAGIPGVRGVVADALTVTPGYERAVAAALGGLVDAVLVESREAARAVVDFATEHQLGIVDVVVAERAAGGAGVTLPSVAGAVPAVSVVEAPPGVRGLLERTLFVSDLDAAVAAISVADADLPLTVVTTSGELVTASTLRGGSGGSDSRIELRAELDAAATARDEASARLVEAEAALADADAAVREASEALAASRAESREAAARVLATRERANRAKAAAEAAAAELQRLTAARAEAIAQREALNEARRSAAEALEVFDAEPAPILDAGDRAAVVEALEAARAAELDARLSLETAKERARGERQRAEALERQARNEEQSREAAARAAAARTVQKEQAERITSALPGILEHVGDAIVEARLQEERLEAKRTAHSAELASLREHVTALQATAQQLTERVHGLELAVHERQLSLSSIVERAESELGLDVEALLAEYAPSGVVYGTAPEPDGATLLDADADADPADASTDPDPVPFDRQAERRRLADAERKLSQLGRVNPLALEEFAALEQRHKFLTEQLADLQKARADLGEIIESINETMQVVFAEAFADTREAFHELFPILFPGGTGSIELVNPADPLTTGIEIGIRPAGKKIDRLSLLSGGERSLAAVAFLMSIFKARPSPFYVMDEVEAALDDANLGRLLSVLETLREGSQLIVITHQKRTMEIADALYGVSMRQDGVSAVVGQRIARDDVTESES